MGRPGPVYSPVDSKVALVERVRRLRQCHAIPRESYKPAGLPEKHRDKQGCHLEICNQKKLGSSTPPALAYLTVLILPVELYVFEDRAIRVFEAEELAIDPV